MTVHPDGAVEARIGSQDIGTGTRTIVAQVLAETFGLELSQVRVVPLATTCTRSPAPRAAVRRSAA